MCVDIFWLICFCERHRRAYRYTHCVFPQEAEYNDIARSSNRISYLYDYMFDEEIVNEDLASALSKLLKAAWRVQSEPLWVPASWVQ